MSSVELKDEENTIKGNHIIELDGICVTIDEFIELFYYKDKNHFEMNPLKYDSDYLNLKKRTKQGIRFNITQEILGLYANDMHTTIDKLETVSTMDIKKKLLSLSSIHHFCPINNALTLRQLFEQVIMDSSYENTLPENIHKIIGTIDEPVYHIFNIYLRLRNDNNIIKNILLKYSYYVKCSGETCLQTLIDDILI